MTDTSIPAGHGDLPVYLATPADPLMVRATSRLMGSGPEPASAEHERRRLLGFFGTHLS